MTRRLGLAMLSGALMALAFPFVLPSLSPMPVLDGAPRELLVLPGVAGLYVLTRAAIPLRQRAGLLFVAGWTHFAMLLYWLDIAMVQFGKMPQWQALPVLFLLVSYCALYWALLPALTQLFYHAVAWPAPVRFALAVVTLEWLRGQMFTGFPWGLWGYSQARNLPLASFASLGGVYLVSFLVALSGAMLAVALRAPTKRRATLRFVAVLALTHGAGWGLLTHNQREDTFGGHEQVALLQGSIPQRVKNRTAEYVEQIRTNYLELARQAVQRGATLLVWPEAAWPGFIRTHELRLPDLALGVPSLMGAGAMRVTEGKPEIFNSAFWVHAQGELVSRYDKRHLVPFGEYVPMRAILPVQKFVPGMIDFSPGHSAAPLGESAVGVLICYDGIFPEIARESIRAGARWLVNLTNDGWYGVSSAPYQHRDFYVLRAIETGRFVLRAANNGISLAITPAGEQRAATTLDTRTVSLANVFLSDRQTPYVRLGDWGVALALGLLVVGLLNKLTPRALHVDKASAHSAKHPDSATST